VNALQQDWDVPAFPQSAWSPAPQTNASLAGIGPAPDFFISATPRIPKMPARSEGVLLPSLADAEADLEAGYRVLENDINQLKKFYVFTAGKPLDLFLASHRPLISTLRDARVPLSLAFGEEKLFRLELSVDEYDVPTVYGVVVWRGSVTSAAQAFNSFSENWWLDHMTPATSDLVFIYRIFR